MQIAKIAARDIPEIEKTSIIHIIFVYHHSKYTHNPETVGYAFDIFCEPVLLYLLNLKLYCVRYTTCNFLVVVCIIEGLTMSNLKSETCDLFII